MIAQLLIIAFLIVLAISLVIKSIVFYHFRKFSLPEDKQVKKIIALHKWGTIFLVLLCVLLLGIFIYAAP